MSVFFSSNAVLSAKIAGKEYLYGDMEKIVNEFNNNK